MKILIIEDDKVKKEKLSIFLEGNEVEIKESFQSGLDSLKKNTYDLLILDMTIPLWEETKNDINQNYEPFGGERILREMKRKKIHVPVVLFTMFDKFPINNEVLTFQQKNSEYKQTYDFYIDGVYYESTNDSWKNILSSLIRKLQ
ncbi:MAG: response regulator [Taibaiella sp.]|nr:response regulator [Taibaiella sp.]